MHCDSHHTMCIVTRCYYLYNGKLLEICNTYNTIEIHCICIAKKNDYSLVQNNGYILANMQDVEKNSFDHCLDINS